MLYWQVFYQKVIKLFMQTIYITLFIFFLQKIIYYYYFLGLSAAVTMFSCCPRLW